MRHSWRHAERPDQEVSYLVDRGVDFNVNKYKNEGREEEKGRDQVRKSVGPNLLHFRTNFYLG